MRVLISGGAGFIGSHLAARLVDSNAEVVVLDSLSAQIHGDDPDSSFTYRAIKDRVELVRGDVRNRRDWERALPGVTHIVHLAAETGTGQSMYNIAHYSDVNVQGTSVLLDILSSKKHVVQHVVLASSRAVYGEGSALCGVDGVVFPYSRSEQVMAAGDFEVKCPICGRTTEPIPTAEDAALRPLSVYATTKLTQELLVRQTCKAIGIGAVALRYQNVYGPGQSLVNPYTGILSIFSLALFEGQQINVFEDGGMSRDFVYIDDVVGASVSALRHSSVEPQAINVGSGQRVTVLEVVKALSAAYGIPLDYQISGNYRVGDIRHNCADTRLMQSVLGFRAAYDFESGIQLFCDWARHEIERNPSRQSRYHNSLHEGRKMGLLKNCPAMDGTGI